MTAEHLARSYYRHINAQDMEKVLGLFSANVVFNLPDGSEVAGRDALRAMYENVFSRGGPQPQPVRIIATENDVAAELEVTLADGGVLRMASFFTMNDAGVFDAVAVYRRG